ncbi:hypothetical protein ACJX0J_042355, partial [Zea mays]
GSSGSGKSIVVLGTAPPDSVAQGPGSSGDLPLPPSTIATIYQVRATEIPLLLHAGLCTPDPTSPCSSCASTRPLDGGAYFFVGANTGALVTCVNNFPETRDVGLDILKGFVGLSGAVYAQLYQALYGGEDAESLILLVAWLPAAVSVAFVHAICYMSYPRRRRRRRAGDELRPFFCFLYLSIALACFLLVMIVVQGQVPFSRAAYGVAAAPLLILLYDRVRGAGAGALLLVMLLFTRF